ncbi:MAG: hypothetical protein ABI927_07095 [Gaiellaceae bacterium]
MRNRLVTLVVAAVLTAIAVPVAQADPAEGARAATQTFVTALRR